MFTNCDAVTIYHPDGAVNHRPVFCRHVIKNVYWEESIGSRQNGKEVQQSDSIYVCIPASSVTDYVPARDDLLFRGIISEEKELHEIQTLPIWLCSGSAHRGDSKLITGFKIHMPTAKDFSNRLQKAQKFVDSEVLRKSDPYVPLKTGMLRDSGVLGTKIGSGRIRYLAPYAKKQYYKGRSSGKRGRYWVKRAMLAHGDAIASGAQKIIDGE